MRLHLRLSPNTEPVPFDHLHRLTGAVHKWLGKNGLHDGLSLYSFGWLSGGKRRGDGLQFAGGAGWNVSFLSDEAADLLRRGIRQDPLVFAGMRVYELREQITPHFGEGARFLVDGAVLTRQNRDDGGRNHLTFEDPASDATLTRTHRRKLAEAGSTESDEVAVRFDRSYEKARTKLVTIKGTEYRTSECPVIVEGPADAVRSAWLLGVGELTGMGLGALK
ncbi:MAG: CRISPR-associated endoribonuclease Cas6 [Bacteroidota bacterium]